MRQQFLGGRQKLHSVRQCRVEFEGRFISPLRIDRENQRLSYRFEYVNAQATIFGTRGYIDAK